MWRAAAMAGTTPLMMACVHAHVLTVCCLVRRGARVDQQDHLGCAAVTWAAHVDCTPPPLPRRSGSRAFAGACPPSKPASKRAARHIADGFQNGRNLSRHAHNASSGPRSSTPWPQRFIIGLTIGRTASTRMDHFPAAESVIPLAGIARHPSRGSSVGALASPTRGWMGATCRPRRAGGVSACGCVLGAGGCVRPDATARRRGRRLRQVRRWGETEQPDGV